VPTMWWTWGPGAGEHGGLIVAQGTPDESARASSRLPEITDGRRRIAAPTVYHAPDKKRMLQITGASGNNLKNITLDLPVGLMVCRDRRFRFR